MFEEDVIKHASRDPTVEACGLIWIEKDLSVTVKELNNESNSPRNSFCISPSQFIEYKLTKKLLGIYHSHPVTTERPSKQDMATSEEMGVPYLIYSLKTNNFFLYYPSTYEPEGLVGRPYIKAFYECTCILKDYFKKELGLDISRWNKNYWLPEKDDKANKLLNSILKNNTIKVKTQELKKHDIIIFEIKKNKRLHVGIYLGGNEFLHQPDKILSKKELLEERWQNKIKQVYRHATLV